MATSIQPDSGATASAPPTISRPPVPSDTMSATEYGKHADENLQKQIDAATPAPTATAAPSVGQRLLTYASSLVHAPGGDWGKRTKEVLRSAGRGMVKAVDETTNTIAEGLTDAARMTSLTTLKDMAAGDVTQAGIDAATRKDNIGEKLYPGFNQAYSDLGGAHGMMDDSEKKNRELIDNKWGRRSDDNLATLTEGLSQFATGMALTAPLAEFAAPLKLGKIGAATITMGHMAATDMTAFDPYEAGLAEMAATLKVPLISQLGTDLSVGKDDDWMVARIKRAVPGALFGAGFEGLIASARWMRFSKIAVNAAKTGDEATAKEFATEAAKQQEIIQNVADGTHTPEGAAVVSRPNPDGTARIEPVRPTEPTFVAPLERGGHPSSAAQEFSTRIGEDPATGMIPGTNLEVKYGLTGGNNVKIEWIKNHGTNPGEMVSFMRKAVKMADELGINLEAQASPGPRVGAGGEAIAGMSPEKLRNLYRTFDFELSSGRDVNMVRRANPTEKVRFREPLKDAAEGVHPDEEVHPIQMPDPVESEAQANTTNYAVRNEAEGNLPITPEQTQTHIDLAKSILSEPDPIKAKQALEDAHFNLNYTSEPDAVVAQVEALSKQFTKELDAAQGTVPVEKSIAMAKKLVGTLTPEDAKALSKGLTEDTKALHVKLLATDIVKQKLGKSLADLSDLLESRPHDEVVQQQARIGLNNFYAVSNDLAGANSEIGRSLNILKHRGAVESADVAFKGEAKAAAEKAAAPAKDALTALKDAIKKASEESTATPLEKRGVGNEAPAGALTTSDFTLARLRKAAEKAKDALDKLRDAPDKHGTVTFEEGNLQADNASLKGERIKEAADAQRADPLELPDLTGTSGATRPTNPVDELSKWIEKADAELEKRLNPPEKAAKPEGDGITSPLQDHLDAAAEADKAPDYVAGMSTRDIAGQLRMIKMADGAPRSANLIAHAATIIKKTGALAKAQEFFVNGLLSGPRTVLTIAQSGLFNLNAAAGYRVAAGIATGNKALMQEGLDIAYGNWSLLKDNFQTASMAAKEGRSIINPLQTSQAIGVSPDSWKVAALTGKAVRLPGNVVQGVDEFLNVTGTRSYIRAKSLRMGREAGLTGEALGARVQEDLRNAFDKDTGICLIPDALAYGQQMAFKAPLRADQWAMGLRDFTMNHPESRFIIPFIKTTANIFDTAWQATPGLNMLNAEARRTILAGGEDAAVLHARSALGGAMWGMALYGASQGQVTGRGPSDPELNKLWKQNHQPYSWRASDTGDWHEYKRWEPWSTILGLAADWHTIYGEMGESNKDASDIAYASVAALTHNLASKTYASSMIDFTNAFSSGEAGKISKWWYGMVGQAVPFGAGLNAANPDSTMREVRSMADAAMARVPGLSTQLDPKFNIFGEPTMKAPGFFNRTFDTWGMSRPSGHSVEDDLLELKKGLPQYPEKVQGLNNIDLTDAQKYGNGTGKSPWIRFNELLRTGVNGEPSFRKQMEDFVKSDKWVDLNKGTDQYPGGTRLLYTQGMKAEAEARVMKKVREEYPKLDQDIRLQTAAKNAALKTGTQPDAQ